MKVQKWGNSLAIRIPKSVADDIGLAKDTEVEVKAINGQLVATPVLMKSKWKLRNLLARITEENLHHETDFGASRGHEAW